MTTKLCPIWGTPADVIPTTLLEGQKGQTFDSPRAGGKYIILDDAKGQLQSLSLQDLPNVQQIKIRLTTWLVEQRRTGISHPIIRTKTIRDAEQWADMAIVERADRILEYLSDKSKYLGVDVRFPISTHDRQDDKTYYELLAHSGSWTEGDFIYLLEYLDRCGYIQRTGDNNLEQGCVLTVEGHTRLEALKKTHTNSNTAFIAMWFDGSMKTAWENGIEPAVRDAGYEPIRIDETPHIGKIDDQIIAEIRRARFVVADFTQGEKTGARGGVYYEAGFAHGLNIPVIFTCRADSLDQVHFDTRQYNHIIWQTEDELRELLKNRILAVIGEGPSQAKL